MKRSISYLCALAGAILSLQTPALFAGDSVETAIATLREAQKSDKPAELIQKAMDDYKEYNPKTGQGHFRANNAATTRHKEAAMDRLQQALDLATAGKDPKEKIDAAIAEMHLSAEFKH